MRLCLDARMIRSGGIGTYIKNLIDVFASEKKIKLTLLHWKKDAHFFKDYPLANKRIIHSPIYSVREQFELPLKIPSCDLFFAPHFNIPLLPIRAKKRATTIHDTYHLTYFSTLSFTQKIYAKLFYNGAIFKSDTLITEAHFAKTEILTRCLLRPKKLEVIYNAYRLNKTSQSALPTHLPSKFILSVGNIKPHKNLLRLLQAYEQLECQEHLLLVGQADRLGTQEKELFDFLERKPALKKRVHFTGYISDDELATLYKKARLFIFPSLYEGFGLPPIEAMAAGVPVVASTAASIPEICKQGAYYIDPYKVSELKEAMQSLLNDEALRKKQIEVGKEVAYGYRFELFKENYLNWISRWL